MIKTLTNRRIEANTPKRMLFNLVINDLKDVLSCYDKAYHYQVIENYLNSYNLFICEHSIRGRIYYILIKE